MLLIILSSCILSALRCVSAESHKQMLTEFGSFAWGLSPDPGAQRSGRRQARTQTCFYHLQSQRFFPLLCSLLSSPLVLIPHTPICPYHYCSSTKPLCCWSVALFLDSLMLRISWGFSFYASLTPTKEVKWPFCSQLLHSFSVTK